MSKINNKISIVRADASDLLEILDLQYLAYQSEAKLLGNPNIPPLTQTLDELRAEYQQGVVLKAVNENIEHLVYSVLTNFSPFKGDTEKHPWMGLDRYKIATEMLEAANDDFSVSDCFEVLKATSQTVCPTVVSMVFDVSEKTVYWCENREWEKVGKKNLKYCPYVERRKLIERIRTSSALQ